MKRSIILEKVNTMNEKIFCQLVLAIYREKLKYKIVEKSLPFEHNSNDLSSSYDGRISMDILDTNYAITIDFNYIINNIRSKYPGTNDIPADPDYYMLDYIDIEKAYLYKGNSEYPVTLAYPVKLSAQYLVGTILTSSLSEIDSDGEDIKYENKIDSEFGNVTLAIDFLKTVPVLESKKSTIKEAFGKVNSGFVTLYHATNKKFLDKIYAEGIKPSIPSKLPNSESLVWAASTADLAIKHASRKYKENEIIVLKLKINSKKQNVFSSLTPNVFTIEGVVNPKNIVWTSCSTI